MLYIVLFFILLFIALLPKKYANLASYFSLIMLLFLASLRSFDIGTDTKGYSDIFNYIKSDIDVSSYIESGWVYLNKIVAFIGLNYTGVLFLSEILCIVPVFYVLKKSVKNYNLGIFIYYGMYLYLHSFNIIRQCVSMSLCLLSYYYFIHRKIKSSILTFLVAFCFHKSALIFSCVYFLRFLNITTGFVIILLFISFLFGIFITNKIILFIVGPYSHFFQNSQYGFREYSVSTAFFCALVNLFFIVFILIKKQSLNKDSVWEKCLITGLCCMNATQTLVLGTRLMFYFTQAQCIFYSTYISNKKKDKFFFLFILCYYLFINFIKILLGQWDSLMPYQFSF